MLVNDQVATRGANGEFHLPVLADNGAGPVLATLKVQAVNGGNPPQVATGTRTQLLPATPESFTYDDDGNLLQDGLWDYAWDGENRLQAMQTRADVATALPAVKRRLEFSYDSQGRRIRKTVETWSSGTQHTSTDFRFLYDGWNLVAEYEVTGSTFIIHNSYAWGPDLSGSRQGAGGVGGLLWANTYGPTPGSPATAGFAPAYDANGNIVAWLDLATGIVNGTRDYGPFGEPLVKTGNAATIPFGFSTKYLDAETGLNYYGFRYYNPSTGRWLSRDPIGEQGGINLYGMVGNNSIDHTDTLGLAAEIRITEDDSAKNYHFTAEGYTSLGPATTGLIQVDDYVGTWFMPKGNNYRSISGEGTQLYSHSFELHESLNVNWPPGFGTRIVKLQPSGEVKAKIEVRNSCKGTVTISWQGVSISASPGFVHNRDVFTGSSFGMIDGYHEGVLLGGRIVKHGSNPNSFTFKLTYSSDWTEIGAVQLGHQFFVERPETISASATLKVKVTAL